MRFMRALSVVILAVGLVAMACGSDDDDGTATPASQSGTDIGPTPVAVTERAEPDGDPTSAGEAVTRFGSDLFLQLRSLTPDDNVSLSPTGLVTALAMVEPGATGTARDQLRQALAIDDPDSFHRSLNALEQSLESRPPTDLGDVEGDSGEIDVRMANAAYLQDGYRFEPAYLDTIGTHYGPVLSTVDFAPDPDAVARRINQWVAEQTNDRITELIPDGVLDPATVLALINTLYLNASWLEPFDADRTADSTPFTRPDGTMVEVAMMEGAGNTSARGDGWVGATKRLNGELSLQVILPDDGRFDDIAGSLDQVFAEYESGQGDGGPLAVPRFETRSKVRPADALKAMGVTDIFEPGNLRGMADDPRLFVDKVLHEVYLAVDEDGIEAAAATAVLVALTAAPAEPVAVRLDRPFLYRIVDERTGATLFIGQIMDPTA
jgi:serpin B